MTHARQREAWNHTASVLALLANIHRDPKKGRAFKPADFHPMPPPESPAVRDFNPPPLKGDIGMLKTVFVPPSRR